MLKISYLIFSSLYLACRLLQVLLSPFSPQHIQQSLFHRKSKSLSFSHILPCFLCFLSLSLINYFFSSLGDEESSCFSFLRFIDVSPAEMFNIMLQGTLTRLVELAKLLPPPLARGKGFNSIDVLFWFHKFLSVI